MVESERLTLKLSTAREIPWSKDFKWVVFSDLHMGNGGSRDDFSRNAPLFHAALKEYYRPKGYGLLLNGDVEEMQKFTWKSIYRAWKTTYGIFESFAANDRLIKTVGNHDARLIMDLKDHSPFPIDTVIKLTGLDFPILLYHGHQISHFYERFNDISHIGLRYFVMPLGIMNHSVAHDSRRRHYLERRIYDYSRRERIISVIGHTHRPLFESLTKAETLRFEIEYLLKRYRTADAQRRKKIEREIAILRKDLVDWRSRKRRPDLQSGLYAEEDVPVPCVFNSGTVIGKRGITGIEFSKGNIRLVHWFDDNVHDNHADRSNKTIQSLKACRCHRTVLRKATMSYVMDSLRLLI